MLLIIEVIWPWKIIWRSKKVYYFENKHNFPSTKKQTFGVRVEVNMPKNSKGIMLALCPRTGFLNLGCWNQLQGVLWKVTCVVVKGKRNAFVFILIATRCLPMIGGARLLSRDQKGCWGRKRLRNAALEGVYCITRALKMIRQCFSMSQRETWNLQLVNDQIFIHSIFCTKRHYIAVMKF